MLNSIYFTVRVWNRGSNEMAHSDFFDELSLEECDTAVVVKGARSLQIRLLTLAVEDFSHISIEDDAGARSEAFAAALFEGLAKASVWLDRQSPDLFKTIRAAGNITDMFIGGWVVGDQFDLDLPVDFLTACSKLGLGITICTND